MQSNVSTHAALAPCAVSLVNARLQGEGAGNRVQGRRSSCKRKWWGGLGIRHWGRAARGKEHTDGDVAWRASALCKAAAVVQSPPKAAAVAAAPAGCRAQVDDSVGSLLESLNQLLCMGGGKTRRAVGGNASPGTCAAAAKREGARQEQNRVRITHHPRRCSTIARSMARPLHVQGTPRRLNPACAALPIHAHPYHQPWAPLTPGAAPWGWAGSRSPSPRGWAAPRWASPSPCRR